MGRDKSKDDKFFNCSEEHEFKYVADLYENYERVYKFLKAKCLTNEIHNSTHIEVFELIQLELGYQIPG